jgi:allantoin racemase
MRLLIINSNTSAAVTDIVAAASRRFASPGTELAFATGSFGARVIASRAENAIAQHATVDLVARYAQGCDGVLIAVSYDSGLRAARELLRVPVLAMTEASILAALTLGSRVGLVIWGQGATELYREIIESYGLGGRICATRRVNHPMPTDAASQTVLDDAIIAAGQDLVTHHEAEVIVLVGAVLAGRSCDLEKRLPIPVLDGIRCGLPMLEAMVRIGASTPTRGSYCAPRQRNSEGLSPSLTDLIWDGSS